MIKFELLGRLGYIENFLYFFPCQEGAIRFSPHNYLLVVLYQFGLSELVKATPFLEVELILCYEAINGDLGLFLTQRVLKRVVDVFRDACDR